MGTMASARSHHRPRQLRKSSQMPVEKKVYGLANYRAPLYMLTTNVLKIIAFEGGSISHEYFFAIDAEARPNFAGLRVLALSPPCRRF